MSLFGRYLKKESCLWFFGSHFAYLISLDTSCKKKTCVTFPLLFSSKHFSRSTGGALGKIMTMSNLQSCYGKRWGIYEYVR